MSDLYNKCVKCIDQVYIDWSKCIKLNKTEHSNCPFIKYLKGGDNDAEHQSE